MKELSVKQRIQDVLLSNTDVYLNHKEIAEIGYGVSYIRDTKNQLNMKIARNVNAAINELLEIEGLHTISKFLPRTPQELKYARRGLTNSRADRISETSPYKSYKIAKEGDNADILLDIKSGQERIDRAIEKRKIIIGKLEATNVFIEG